MEKNENDVYVMGIGADTYSDLNKIAKKESKSVADVTSEALKRHIDEKKKVNEDKQEPRLLMEG